MKIDARTKYTLKAIKTTFTELLKENPVNKVTVKAICDKAGINRATFYRYYNDIFDLYEKLKEELIEEFLMNFDKNQPRDVESDFLYLLGRIKENMDSVCALANQGDVFQVMEKISKKNYARFDEIFSMFNSDISKEERMIVYRYITYGCMGSISEWISGGTKKDEKEMARLLTKMFINTLRNF